MELWSYLLRNSSTTQTFGFYGIEDEVGIGNGNGETEGIGGIMVGAIVGGIAVGLSGKSIVGTAFNIQPVRIWTRPHKFSYDEIVSTFEWGTGEISELNGAVSNT